MVSAMSIALSDGETGSIHRDTRLTGELSRAYAVRGRATFSFPRCRALLPRARHVWQCRIRPHHVRELHIPVGRFHCVRRVRSDRFGTHFFAG
jgi:hypothetical protein